MSQATCDHCGAVVPYPRPNFCSYCGVGLAPVEPPPPKPTPSNGDRLVAVEAHPDFGRLLDLTPSSAGLALGRGAQVLFGLIFTVAAGFMVLVFGAVGGPLALIPLLFVVAGIAMTVQALKKSADLSGAKLIRFPAIVLSERTSVSGRRDAATRTTYYATLEWQDGGRREFEVPGELSGSLVVGDAGLAFAKGPYLLDFRRLDV